MSSDAANDARLALLQELVTTARRSPFQATRLGALGWDKGVPASIDEFCRRMPTTTKEQLMEDRVQHPPFGSNMTVPLESCTRFCQTSGTSGGQPMGWLDTPESWRAMLEGWRQVYRAAGVRPGEDRLMFAFSFGPFLGFWTAFEAATPDCLCLPGGGLSSAARLDLMQRYGVTVLCCTPTYALRLGALARELERSTKDVRTLILAGEPGAAMAATRGRLQELWPAARIVDHHGMTEVGPVSYEHPSRERALVVMEDQFVAEVIDPTSGESLPLDGQHEGELVLTTLKRTACPLLRYRTGDLVRARRLQGESPPVGGSMPEPGSTLILEGGVLGRCDDMRLIRGVNLYPSAVEDRVRRIDQVDEFEIHERSVDDMRELEVVIEVGPGRHDGREVARRLGEELRNCFSLRIPVRLAEPGSLPRHEFKSRRWRVVGE